MTDATATVIALSAQQATALGVFMGDVEKAATARDPYRGAKARERLRCAQRAMSRPQIMMLEALQFGRRPVADLAERTGLSADVIINTFTAACDALAGHYEAQAV